MEYELYGTSQIVNAVPDNTDRLGLVIKQTAAVNVTTRSLPAGDCFWPNRYSRIKNRVALWPFVNFRQNSIFELSPSGVIDDSVTFNAAGRIARHERGVVEHVL